MQFKFVTALLLVGACLTQVSLAQSDTDIQQKGYIEDLINQAKIAIEQVTNFMKKVIQDALRVFNELKDKVISIAQEAIATGEQLLNNVISDARKQIQEIAGRAKGLGVDISACIVSENQFQELLNGFLYDEKQCVQKEIDSVLVIINESIEIYTNEVHVLPAKLWECGSGLSSIGCIKDVILQATMSESQLPLNIAKKIADTTNYVAGLPIRLEMCAATQVAAAGIETAKIVAGVTQCAARAIGDNNQN